LLAIVLMTHCLTRQSHFGIPPVKAFEEMVERLNDLGITWRTVVAAYLAREISAGHRGAIWRVSEQWHRQFLADLHFSTNASYSITM